ncbi:MAG: hypothetical protein F6J93_38275 [Oscillatoria sp. SIO1A7]|nr:hypothetical protein [Oscillatoria sp. SIO1A7]
MHSLEFLEHLAHSLAPSLLLFQAIVAFTEILERDPRYSYPSSRRVSYQIKNAVFRASLAVYGIVSLIMFIIEMVQQYS